MSVWERHSLVPHHHYTHMSTTLPLSQDKGGVRNQQNISHMPHFLVGVFDRESLGNGEGGACLAVKTKGALTHEIVIPGTLGRDHEESQETVRQEHLHLLVVGGQVPVGIVARVLVVPSPLVARGCQFVRRQ